MSVIREPPTVQAASPLTPGVHAENRLNRSVGATPPLLGSGAAGGTRLRLSLAAVRKPTNGTSCGAVGVFQVPSAFLTNDVAGTTAL